jgi:hypothetical protein
MAYLQS